MRSNTHSETDCIFCLCFQSQKMFTLTEPNSVHMFWLIPQYFVITVGEVMFSITGLEFSFTQVGNSDGLYDR